jgi:hypothetical protein
LLVEVALKALSEGRKEMPLTLIVLDAIVDDNLLGRPSIRARQASMHRLQQLYGIGGTDPIWLALKGLWARENSQRPPIGLSICPLANNEARSANIMVLD